MSPEPQKLDLAVAMIVRNAASTLLQALNSVVDLAQEIRIVDTGSQDQSLEIASQFTSNISQYVWQNHFGEARNLSIQGLKSQWILLLDADEWLLPASHSTLADLLKHLPPGRVVVNGQLEAQNQKALSKRMLFRNHCGLHFIGHVHERPEIKDFSVDATPIQLIDCPELKLGHQVTASGEKTRYYLQLIQQELRTQPGALRQAELYYHQAESLLAQDLSAARVSIQKSLLACQQAKVSPEFQANLILCLLQIQLKQGAIQAARELALIFQVTCPQRPEGWFYRAYCDYWLGEPTQLERHLQIAEKHRFPALELSLLRARLNLSQQEIAHQQAAFHSLLKLASDHARPDILAHLLRACLLNNQPMLAAKLWKRLFPGQLMTHSNCSNLRWWSPLEKEQLCGHLYQYPFAGTEPPEKSTVFNSN